MNDTDGKITKQSPHLRSRWTDLGYVADSGALLAALVFREGIHSSHFGAYVALTLLFNFLLFGD